MRPLQLPGCSRLEIASLGSRSAMLCAGWPRAGVLRWHRSYGKIGHHAFRSHSCGAHSILDRRLALFRAFTTHIVSVAGERTAPGTAIANRQSLVTNK